MPKRRGNNEIQIARGRLKGILQDLADLDDEYDESDKINLPLRGRPPKRLKQEKNESLTSVHESFVMKLFDRSLDLAKFQENTPLYSICRSWNLNKPRANLPDNENEVRYDETQKREKMPELEEKILKNDIGLIFNMPAQKEFVEDVKKKEKRIINDFTINTSSQSKQDIMKNHKLNWKKVKEDWMEKVKKRHDRYDLSFKLLNAIKDI